MLNCIGCSFMSGPFKELEDEELNLFAQKGSTVKFTGGEMVFKQYTPISQVAFLRQGCIKILKQYNNSHKYVSQLVTGPGFLGLTNTFAENFYDSSAVTLSNAEICFIDKDAFDLVLNMNGRFASCMLKAACSGESQNLHLNHEIFRRQLAGKVARILIYFSETVFKRLQFELPLSKTEMASLIGVSNRSLTRTLGEFMQDGLIGYCGTEMTLIRKEFLEKLAQQ